ncbi:MAG: CvpA family protein [Oscillospiraceae bacterium]
MTWLILDAILVLILAICFFLNYHRGLISAVISIAAVIVSLLLGFYVSNRLTEPIYENFVRERLGTAVEKRIESDGGGALDEVTDGIGSLLGGEEAKQQLIDAANGAKLVAAEKIVDDSLQNGAKTAIRTALFILIYVVVSLILTSLARMMRGVNKIPLLGFANKLLGGALGFAIGALYCFMFVSACALIINITVNTLSWMNMDIINQTKIMSVVYPYNLFALLANAAV